MSSTIQNIKDYFLNKKNILQYITKIYRCQNQNIPKQHKLNIQHIMYYSIFIGINSIMFCGIGLKLYSRIKALSIIGVVTYINICWYFIWIENLYKKTILTEKGRLGYIYRKQYRQKFGNLPKKQEDQKYEKLIFSRIR